MTDDTLARMLQKHAYAITMENKTLVEAMGMQAANSQSPESQPFTKADFDKLIEDNGCHHNAVLTEMQWP